MAYNRISAQDTLNTSVTTSATTTYGTTATFTGSTGQSGANFINQHLIVNDGMSRSEVAN